jgi:hypothetical protein
MISKGSRYGVGSPLSWLAFPEPQVGKWRPAPLFVITSDSFYNLKLMPTVVTNRTHLKALVSELASLYELNITLQTCMAELFLLPDFLHEVIFFHYYLNLSDTETATTLNISEALVRQRVRVSTTLINILYASKPKNPV